MKILFYVERGLYECIKIYFNINFLYNHPKASKRPLIAVPIIMNNPVDKFEQKLNYLFWWVRVLLFALTVIKIGSKTTKTSFQRLCLISACFKQNWSEVEIGLNLMSKKRVYERKIATKMAEHVSLFLLEESTVSTLLQPWASIFQNGFLGGVQFKLDKNLTIIFQCFDLDLNFWLGFYYIFHWVGFYSRVGFK